MRWHQRKALEKNKAVIKRGENRTTRHEGGRKKKRHGDRTQGVTDTNQWTSVSGYIECIKSAHGTEA